MLGLVDAQATNKNIAEVLTKKTGKSFSSQDVRNIVTRIKDTNMNVETIEEVLAEIKEDAGDVKYKKKDGSNDVEVLFIQTETMIKGVVKNRPDLFESDTTFGTQIEGYKIWCPVYYDQFVGKWEVAALVFLSTERKENVESGIRMFKDSLKYRYEQHRFIFIVDKDFDYINVLEEFFPGSIVLLCNVHTSRYFREKVFMNKAFWGDPKDAQYLGKFDKDELMEQLQLVRDSLSGRCK